MDDSPTRTRRNPLIAGFHASWITVLLIAAINTGIALVLKIDDPRPFWHPLVTVQLFGFSIAYCVNVAAPWDKPAPVWRMVIASAVGAMIGSALVLLVKTQFPPLAIYTLQDIVSRATFFAMNTLAAFFNGLLISLIFYIKFRETRASAALHRAEAERHLLSKQAIEAELKLMQAQVEPHFLFNTLASVQYLTETDPKQASALLTHLIAYLRAALPELRASSTTLGKEAHLAEAYLNVLAMRKGPRLSFAVDIPPDLAQHPFPPNLLLSLVENSVKHGLEPAAAGGRIDIRARRNGNALVIAVDDTGKGLPANGATVQPGVGLSNVRDRLAALYGTRAHFSLEPAREGGAHATLTLPLESGY